MVASPLPSFSLHKHIFSLVCCIFILLVYPPIATATPEETDKASDIELEKVSLQLVWKHQFEFAGFYAAIEKGFYRERGLEVELKEYQAGQSIVEEVVNGKSTYGLSNSQVVAERLQGQPIRLLANYFKRPPIAIVAREGLKTLEDLKGKRLMIDSKDLESPLFRKAFKTAGLKPGENIDIIPHVYSPTPFLEGKVDATTLFVTNELYFIEESSTPHELIDLSSYLPALGDVYLFTTEKETDKHTQRTQAFIEASNKGWEYALAYPEEIIDLILEKYSRRKSKDALLYEAQKTEERILPVAFPLGSIYYERIDKVAEVILEKDESSTQKTFLNNFIFRRTQSSPDNQFNLSRKEIDWLKQHKTTIRYCFNPVWTPYDYQEDGQHKGIFADYLTLLSARLDIKLNPVISKTWGETLQNIKEGKCDLISGAVRNNERESYLDFTAPYFRTSHVLLAKPERPIASSFAPITNKTIAVPNNSAIAATLKQTFPDTQFIDIDSPEEMHNAIESGKVYAGVVAFEHAARVVKQKLYNLSIIGKLDYEYPISIAVSKDSPILLSIMNKAVSSLTTTDHNTIERNWHSINIVQSVDYTALWKVIFIAVSIIAIVFYWNRQLTQLNTRLAKANEKVVKANETKSQFLANMSHEVRTPLNAIIGIGHLMRKTKLNSQQTDYIDKLDSSSKLLLGIIDDILDISKIEAGKLVLNFSHFKLTEITQQINCLFAEQAKQKGLELTTSINNDVPNCLYGDPQRLTQILMNLIGNAIKFTESGKVAVYISCPTKSDKHVILQFSVEDTGPGISSSQQQKLFQPFSQVDASLSRKYGGSGLGLAISQYLAELMGSKIILESEPGKGSLFKFTINFNACNENTSDKILPTSSTMATLKNLHILLVEDDELNQMIAKEFILSIGAKMTLANNGIEALDLLKSRSFDVILMDLQMPKMDGYQATEIIRQHSQWDNIPIIAMTAHTISEEIKKFQTTGMDGYITKPIEPDELTKVLIKYNNLSS